ncbi:hypothetical protein Tco_0499491 [Tanacetum coccineum]
MDGFNYQPCSLVVDTISLLDEWEFSNLNMHTDPFFLSSYPSSYHLWLVKHAVAIASAQKNKGSLEAESIVRAASNESACFIFKQHAVLFQVFEADEVCIAGRVGGEDSSRGAVGQREGQKGR